MIRQWLKNTITKMRNAQRDERGVTAVEFALVAPVFLMFSLGIIDFSRLYWVKNTMQFAVEQTARQAMVDPNLTSSELVSYAENEAQGLFSGITFTASSQTIGNTQYKTVAASYNFTYQIPFINLSQIPLAAQARTPVTVSSSGSSGIGSSGSGSGSGSGSSGSGNGCSGGSSGSDGGDSGEHHSDGGDHMGNDNSGSDNGSQMGNDNPSHMGDSHSDDGESHASDDGNESSDSSCNSTDSSSHDGNESEDGSSSEDGNSSQDGGGDS